MAVRNIVDEIAVKLGLPTSEALAIMTDPPHAFLALRAKGIDPLTAARLATQAGQITQTDPRTGGAQGSEFADIQTEEVKPRPKMGTPVTDTPGAVPGSPPTAAGKQPNAFQRLVSRVPGGLPLQEIDPREPPIVTLAKGFYNTLAYGGTSNALREEQEMRRKEFEMRGRESEERIAASEQARRASEASMRYQKTLQAVQTGEILESLQDSYTSQSPETQAKIAKADYLPERLAKLIEEGNIEEYSKGRAMYETKAARDRDKAALAYLGNPRMVQEFGLESMEDAYNLYDSHDANKLAYDFLESKLRLDVTEANLNKILKDQSTEDADVALGVTSAYDKLLEEEQELIGKLEFAKQYDRIITRNATTPEERLAAQEKAVALGMVVNAPDEIQSQIDFLHERMARFRAAAARRKIPGLVEDLERRVVPTTDTGHNKILEDLSTALGLKKPSPVPGVRGEGSSEVSVPYTLGRALDGVANYALTGNSMWEIPGVIGPASGAMEILGQAFRWSEGLDMDRMQRNAERGYYDKDPAFLALKERLATLAVRHGLNPTNADLNHDAAIIAWHSNNHPTQELDTRKLRLGLSSATGSGIPGELLQPEGANAATRYTASEMSRRDGGPNVIGRGFELPPVNIPQGVPSHLAAAANAGPPPVRLIPRRPGDAPPTDLLGALPDWWVVPAPGADPFEAMNYAAAIGAQRTLDLLRRNIARPDQRKR